jgi:hypothetical protein
MDCPAISNVLRFGLTASIAAVASVGIPAPAFSTGLPQGVLTTTESACTQAQSGEIPPVDPGRSALTFGIYPGGGAGGAGIPKPDRPGKRLAALDSLRGKKSLIIRLYEEFTGSISPDRYSLSVESQIASYTNQGFDVEVAINYRPVGDRAGRNISRFIGFIKRLVDRVSSDHRVGWIQIGNEGNLTPHSYALSADGSFSGAQRAIVEGVEAAKAEATRDHDSQLQVGINWVDIGVFDATFWLSLRRIGGVKFARSLDWVGFDYYPFFYYPFFLPNGTNTLVEDLDLLRECYLPIVERGSATPIQIVETGYPTGPGRTFSMQVNAMKEIVTTALEYRQTFHVTSLIWFDLRDADTDGSTLADHYGLLRDNYSPKPAFNFYKQLINSYGRGSRS